MNGTNSDDIGFEFGEPLIHMNDLRSNAPPDGRRELKAPSIPAPHPDLPGVYSITTSPE